jgi:serine/threonine protein kinase
MPAKWLKFGDPPPTPGGEVEIQIARRLGNDLPEGYLVLSSLSLPTKGRGYFYEIDLVVVSPFLCEVIDIKHVFPAVTVEEDSLQIESGPEFNGVFSLLDTKARVLNGRFHELDRQAITCPFSGDVRIGSRVIVGPDCQEIRFGFPDHQAHKKVLTIDEAVGYYTAHFHREAKTLISPALKRLAWEQEHGWSEFAKARGAAPKRDRLGRFRNVRPLPSESSFRDYEADDEPPCKVKVHLREYPFDPTLRGKALETYLADLTRDMQLLRQLRHPYLTCVTGHFRTGWSLVQVNDWFDGKPLNELETELSRASLREILQLMLMLTQALVYCHGRGVFHRNLEFRHVLVAPNWNDIRLRGFDFAKQLDRTRTLTEEQMKRRDPRLIPPEEREKRAVDHYGRYDMYQLGVLFYRMLEGGAWPWEQAGSGSLRPLGRHEGEPVIGQVRTVVLSLFSEDPEDRPYSLTEVERIVRDSLLH